MLITQWCAFVTGCRHWFNALNGGPKVASVGICGIYLCMWLQKVNVIYRNNGECILGKIASSITLRSAERSCKNLLCVSTDATAPNLFKMVTIAVVPPWQRIRSVKGSYNGTQHWGFMVKSNTHRAYTVCSSWLRDLCCHCLFDCVSSVCPLWNLLLVHAIGYSTHL